RSVYTSAIAGGVTVDGYKSLDQAVMRLLTRLDGQREPRTYTYFYYPHVDTAAHAYGPSAPEVRDAVEVLDAALARLHEGLDGRARIILSSDHGGIDVDGAQKRVLASDEHLATLLRTPPTCEPRAPVFHVLPGAETEFADAFRARFGEHFALLTADEVIELGLLGPVPPSETCRSRLGAFMALSEGRDVLIYDTDTGMTQMIGFHGGLLPDEVRIPLVVA
ncbi:MAG: alkaline phosphatase family protein, partial [Dehalococcoidia bacterium]